MRVTIKTPLGTYQTTCKEFPFREVNSILKKDVEFTSVRLDRVVCNRCLQEIYTVDRYEHKCSEVLDFDIIRPDDIELNNELHEDDL